MHDVLRQRLMRRIESLPEEQVYQVLDFIEFLESKYARNLQVETTGIQRFAEGLEDKMRKKAMNPATLREAFQLIAAADRALSSVSAAGRQILTDLGSLGEGEGTTPPTGGGVSGGGASGGSVSGGSASGGSPSGGGLAGGGASGGRGPAGRPEGSRGPDDPDGVRGRSPG